MRMLAELIALSNYCGSGKECPDGPSNTYIYNNVIYVGEDFPTSTTAFTLDSSLDGLLIQNNIFYVHPDVNVIDDSDRTYPTDSSDTRFKNNLYNRDFLPKNLPYSDDEQIIAEPNFEGVDSGKKTGFKPLNHADIVAKGYRIWKLTQSNTPHVWTYRTLQVDKDTIGTPICKKSSNNNQFPDMGAIELYKTPCP